MGDSWPNFCCEGYGFIVLECDSSGYGYGLCMNPKCPHGDELQAFQLDWCEDDDEEYYPEELPSHAD